MKEKIETFLESAKPKYVHVIQVFFVIKRMLKGLLYWQMRCENVK